VIVRKMSAHPVRIPAVSAAVENEQLSTHADFWHAMSSPKAEVRGSNPFGRAS
jgi:hypothetical protein